MFADTSQSKRARLLVPCRAALQRALLNETTHLLPRQVESFTPFTTDVANYDISTASLHKCLAWQTTMFSVSAGFPEPAPFTKAGTANEGQDYNIDIRSDRELERQPMLEAIPWEPHNAVLQL